MDLVTALVGVSILVGFYMAWNIGANDVANAMGTSVGSGALTLKRAVILAAIFEFSGCILLGSKVSLTIQNGIIHPDHFTTTPYLLAYGMLASLFAAGVWLQIASYFGWPVSTTHTIIGALIGFGLVFGPPGTVDFATTFSIVGSWVLSPILGAIFAYLLYLLSQQTILKRAHPIQNAYYLLPWVGGMLSLGIAWALLREIRLDFSLRLPEWQIILGSSFMGLIAAGSFYLLLKRFQVEQLVKQQLPPLKIPQAIDELNSARSYLEHACDHAGPEFKSDMLEIMERVENISHQVTTDLAHHSAHIDDETLVIERLFGYLQIITACFMAFAHGANDVANAIGPLSAIVQIFRQGKVTISPVVPIELLVLGGIGIVIGLATWGWRVIRTVGHKITELDPIRGFCAEMGTVVTILFASKFGLPVSTTHTLIGALFGIGLSRGIKMINLGVLRQIILSWLITVPIGAMIAIIVTSFLKFFLPVSLL